MANKSGMERFSDLAHHAQALKDIIRAALSGGWHAAALQALKHYWPQILTIALVLLFLPLIIFLCLPAMLFGFADSGGIDNTQAQAVSGYYSRYEAYCAARVEAIRDSIMGGGSGDDTVHNPEVQIDYEVVVAGSPMEADWFITLHSVCAGNDLNAMNEQSVMDFVEQSVVYTIEDKPEEPEPTEPDAGETNSISHDDTVNDPLAPSDSSSGEASIPSEETLTKILTIRYLTPLEFMDYYDFSDADRNWALLMYQTLQGESSPAIGATF